MPAQYLIAKYQTETKRVLDEMMRKFYRKFPRQRSRTVSMAHLNAVIPFFDEHYEKYRKAISEVASGIVLEANLNEDVATYIFNTNSTIIAALSSAVFNDAQGLKYQFSYE